MKAVLLPCMLAAASTPAGNSVDLFGSLVVPLLAGAVAIYLLLPRPRPWPWIYGLAVGILALVLGGVFLVPATAVTPEVVLFYAFSAMAITSGALLVTQHNPARAALSFALVVLSTCGLFLLLAAPFLMAATIIIYAGAIIVTFLFVLMLAQQAGLSDADVRSREPLLATLSGFLLLGTLLYVLRVSYGGQEIERLLERTRQARAQDSRTEVLRIVGDPASEDELFNAYHRLLGSRHWLDLDARVDKANTDWGLDLVRMHQALDELASVAQDARQRVGALQPPAGVPLSAFSGPPANVDPKDLRRDAAGRPVLPAENSAYLGLSLFSDFLLPVELGGTLLLVATVGAIAIAHRRGQPSRAS
jgi:NADH:ubiquinone oxidoreductase subunit 6 (subunit J)